MFNVIDEKFKNLKTLTDLEKQIIQMVLIENSSKEDILNFVKLELQTNIIGTATTFINNAIKKYLFEIYPNKNGE